MQTEQASREEVRRLKAIEAAARKVVQLYLEGGSVQQGFLAVENLADALGAYDCKATKNSTHGCRCSRCSLDMPLYEVKR